MIKTGRISEYPTEYLLSRIRGRQSFFIKEWESLADDPYLFDRINSDPYRDFSTAYSIDGIRIRLLKEFSWIHLQMNNELRDIFRPFFIYTEIRTFLICFRYGLTVTNNDEIVNNLEYSLLTGKIKSILSSGKELPDVLKDMESFLSSACHIPVDLSSSFATEGLSETERKLSYALLNHILAMKLHPVIKVFFRKVIDRKNLTALYKHLRWGIEAEPLMLTGGHIDIKRLSRIFQSGKLSELDAFIDLHFSISFEGGPARIEKLFHRDLKKQLTRLSRESHDTGLILCYLWRAHMEARNLSLLLRGKEMDRNLLKEELVY